ncbi:MAG: hypothetical protein H7Y16_05080, partial [Candidatus Parcubacteria bacterium]|nr:hypothetical protein [Burkholderiales bacterium]
LLCIAGLLASQVGLMLQPSGAWVPALWLVFAFFGAGGATGYIVLGQMFPPEQMGRVSTAANALTLAGAFFLQSAIGWILDLWPRTASGGWDPDGYTAALGLSAGLHLLVTAHLLGWTTFAKRSDEKSHRTNR